MKTLTYEDFCTPGEVETYKRVKRRTMQIARAARGTVKSIVGGELTQGEHDRKEFLTVDGVTYRLAMSDASDNQTERRAHEYLGARTIVMGDEEQMKLFFERHGLNGAATWVLFVDRLRRALA